MIQIWEDTLCLTHASFLVSLIIMASQEDSRSRHKSNRHEQHEFDRREGAQIFNLDIPTHLYQAVESLEYLALDIMSREAIIVFPIGPLKVL